MVRVGPDAHRIDELVRRSPEGVYDVDFFEQFAREVGWSCLPDIAPTLLSPTRRRGRGGGPIWIGARKQGSYT